MVKVYLCNTDMSYSILLPVTPSEITVSTATNVRTYETASDGIITQIGYTQPCSISFSSFFPSDAREYSFNNTIFGMDFVHLVEWFSKGRKPCRLIIVGMDFDRDMILERFEYSRKRGNDVYYTMSFTERKAVS